MLGVAEVEPLPERPLLLNMDLFDAEDSDSDMDHDGPRSPTPPPDVNATPISGDRTPPPEEDNHLNTEEDGENSVLLDDTVDEELAADTQKQKSSGKKNKKDKSSIAQSRTRRFKKVDGKKIHSESQRIIRESDVSLPYHKPKPLSLNDFFSKKPSNKGGLSVKSLKGLSKRQQIAHLIQEPNTHKSNPTKRKENASQISPSAKSPDHSPTQQNLNITAPEVKQLFTNEKTADSPPNKMDQKHETSVSVSQADNSMHLELDDSSNDSGIEDKTAPLVANSTSEIEMEVVLGKERGGSSSKEGASESQESALFSEKDDSPSLNRATTFEMNKSTLMEISTEEIGTTSETSVSHQETNDQETSELNESRSENSNEFPVKNKNEDFGNREELSATQETPSVQKDDNTTITLSSSTHKVKLSPKSNLSQTPTQDQHSHNRLLLLNESLSKVKTLTPRLSGAADAIIDLDDDDDDDVQFATPSNPGLNRLIQRFVKHTARSAPRPTQEVKLSVVSKQSGGDGKEDLKLDTVAVTIEGEEEVDLSLKVPGAKLLKLKESLQVKMRARREVERQRRKEAYRLDNEDYIENEDEITDKSETDDDDDDGLKDESKIKKKKLPNCHFLNREADVDDDDDDDYDPENDDSDSNSDQDDARSDNESPATKAEIYSAETDESDQDIENDDQDDNDSGDEMVVVRTKSDKRKKKKLVLDDGDEDEDEDTGSKDVSMHEESTLELHLDADDEDEEHENRMNQDDSSMGFPTKTRTPLYQSTINAKHSVNQSSRPPKRPLESLSSIDGTTDSSDVDRLAESILRRRRSPKRSLINEEKTRDLFESTSNTDGGTTGSSEVGLGNESIVGQSSFSWSAIQKRPGISPRDPGQTNRELTKPLDSSSNSLDTSLELVGSMITAHQPGGGFRKNSCKESPDVNATGAFVPFAKHHSLLHNAPKSKLSELTLPVEDSQDLYRSDTPSLTVAMETQLGDDTQGFRFSYEDEETQTQFLDENGFLKLRSISKPRPTTKKLFGDENSTQDPMDELLGLCSGKFSNGTSENVSKIRKGLFSQLGSTQHMDSTQGNMDEVLGLCSGTFATQNATSQGKMPSPDDIEDCSESSFRIISDDEGNENDDKKDVILSGDECSKPKTRKRIRVMDDDSDDDNDDQEGAESEEEEEGGVFDSEDEMMVMLKEEQRNGKQDMPKKAIKEKMRNKISRDFFENEAELSGSEFDSDENYDADDLPDELEQNEADKENVGTAEQLRQQVNKVYMKTMDDEDARRLRLYKEIYLPDGDLHTDGKGRTRQFRWRHLDDDSQMNLFPNNSDDEAEDDNDEDTQWRMERFKREQWLNEHKEKQAVKENVDQDENIEEEGSQFDILMKTAVNKKKKVLPSVDLKVDESVQKKDSEKRIASPKQTKFRNGSFLKRSKGDLAKIASMMKPLSNNPGTSRSSRNVLYQSIAPQGEEEEEKSKPQVRRSTSDRPDTKAPKAKRPRLDRSQSLANPSSIFSLM